MIVAPADGILGDVIIGITGVVAPVMVVTDGLVLIDNSVVVAAEMFIGDEALYVCCGRALC